jgi:hypothetical protein
MNQTRRMEADVFDDNGPFRESDRDPTLEGRDHLAAWAAELEHRIDLLEEDITFLCRAAGMAALREKELLSKLGLPDDALQRDNGELLAQIAVPSLRKR